MILFDLIKATYKQNDKDNNPKYWLYHEFDKYYADEMIDFITNTAGYNFDALMDDAQEFVKDHYDMCSTLINVFDNNKIDDLNFYIKIKRSSIMNKYNKLTLEENSDMTANSIAKDLGITLRLYNTNPMQHSWSIEDRQDCTIRATTKLLNKSYGEVRNNLNEISYNLGSVPNSTAVVQQYLAKYGYIGIGYAISRMEKPTTVYEILRRDILSSSIMISAIGHMFCVVDNNLFDSYPILSDKNFVNHLLIADIENLFVHINSIVFEDEIKYQLNILKNGPSLGPDDVEYPNDIIRRKIIYNTLMEYKNNDK